MNRDIKGQADIIIAKHRNGETGTVGFTFKGQYCKFLEKSYINKNSRFFGIDA